MFFTLLIFIHTFHWRPNQTRRHDLNFRQLYWPRKEKKAMCLPFFQVFAWNTGSSRAKDIGYGRKEIHTGCNRQRTGPVIQMNGNFIIM